MSFAPFVSRNGQISRRSSKRSRNPGPWIAGIDFPFGQSRTFIENIGWPDYWAGYVECAGSLGREGFRNALDAYRERRPFGDKDIDAPQTSRPRQLALKSFTA